MQPSLRRSRKATSELAVRDDDPALPVVLEFQSPAAAAIAAPAPYAARSVLWLVTSLVLSLVIALSVIRVDRVVTMDGKVVPDVPTEVVQPFDQSIVRSIDVHEGQEVHAGQLLARLDPTLATADMDALRAEVSSYSAQVARMQAEANNQPFTYAGTDPNMLQQVATYDQRKAQYEFQLENYKQQIDGLVYLIERSNADAAGYRDRLEVAQNLENMRRELERMHVGSRLNTLAAVDNRAEMARNLADSLQTAANAKTNLAAMIATRDGYIQQWHADINDTLADTASKLSDAREALRKADLHHRLVELRADHDGQVLTVAKVSVGSVLQPGQELFTLMPAGAPLAVAGILPSDEGGFVHVGDPVTIKFDTFQYSLYGMAYGTLTKVSADTFFSTDQQAAATSPVPMPSSSLPNAAFYRGQVSIDRLALRNLPPGFKVTPGMTVTADIVFGKRTLMSYFFSKLVSATSEGFREP